MRLILVAVLLLLTPFDAEAEQLTSERVIVDFEPDRVPRAVAEKALEQAETYLVAIVDLIGGAYEPTGPVRITLHGEANREDPTHYPRVDRTGRVHLYQFGPSPESHLSPLAHELVHVLRNPHVTQWIGFVEEGFASFVSVRVAPDLAGFPFFGFPVDAVAGQWLGGDEDIPLSTMWWMHGSLNMRCRLQTYSLRTAFFDDLGRRHGDPAVAAFADDVARTGKADFEGAFGSSFNILADVWHEGLSARFKADASLRAEAEAWRAHPALRGFPVCTESGEGAWAPRTIGRHGSAEPPTRKLRMREVWRRGQEGDDLFFGNLDRVTEDAEGRVYALDTQLCEVRVFGADGEELGTIGRRGEGPGEFDRPADLFAGLGGTIGVLESYPGRIVTLDAEGQPTSVLGDLGRAGEGAPSYRRARANAGLLALSGARADGPGTQEHYLELHSADGQLVAQLHGESGQFQYGGMEYVEPGFVRFHRRWDMGRSGRVAAAIDFESFRIQVWNPDGSEAFEITNEAADPVRRTDDEKAALQRFYNGITSFNPRSTFEVSGTHPAIHQVVVRADDSLWVISGGGAFRTAEGVAAVVDVYDSSGAPTHRLALHGPVDLARDEIYVVDDRVYVVTEAQDAAVSATGGSAEEGDDGVVEASQLVCFELESIPRTGQSN